MSTGERLRDVNVEHEDDGERTEEQKREEELDLRAKTYEGISVAIESTIEAAEGIGNESDPKTHEAYQGVVEGQRRAKDALESYKNSDITRKEGLPVTFHTIDSADGEISQERAKGRLISIGDYNPERGDFSATVVRQEGDSKQNQPEPLHDLNWQVFTDHSAQEELLSA